MTGAESVTASLALPPLLAPAVRDLGLNLTLLIVLLIGTAIGIFFQGLLFGLWRYSAERFERWLAGRYYSRATAASDKPSLTDRDTSSIRESHLRYVKAKVATGEEVGLAEMQQLLPQVNESLADETLASMARLALRHPVRSAVFVESMGVVCAELYRRKNGRG